MGPLGMPFQVFYFFSLEKLIARQGRNQNKFLCIQTFDEIIGCKFLPPYMIGLHGFLSLAYYNGTAFAYPVPVAHGKEGTPTFKANPASPFQSWQPGLLPCRIKIVNYPFFLAESSFFHKIYPPQIFILCILRCLSAHISFNLTNRI